MIASVLAMFNISKARDEHGNEIEINDEYSTFGMLTYVFFLKKSDKIRTYKSPILVIKSLSSAQLHLDLPLLEN